MHKGVRMSCAKGCQRAQRARCATRTGLAAGSHADDGVHLDHARQRRRRLLAQRRRRAAHRKHLRPGADARGHYQGHPARRALDRGLRLARDASAIRGIQRRTAGPQPAQGVQEESRANLAAHHLHSLLWVWQSVREMRVCESAQCVNASAKECV